MTDETLPVPRAAASHDTASTAAFLRRNFREYGMLLCLIAIMVFFQVMTDGTLMQPLNLTNLVLQNSYIVIMALGMLLVIVAGHIDLSVGSVSGFVGALAAVLMVNHDWPVLPATLAFAAPFAPGGGRKAIAAEARARIEALAPSP